FYPFKTEEEKWAYWAKHISINRFEIAATPLYEDLFQLVREKEYFVISTNVESQFVKAGFPEDKVFEIQGDYSYLQCEKGCHDTLYYNEPLVKEMIEQTRNCRIPAALVPKCPVCGGKMDVNLRKNGYFVQDEKWYGADRRYNEYLSRSAGRKIVYAELGVGFNTPGIIRGHAEDYAGFTRVREKTIMPKIALQDYASAIDLQDKFTPPLSAVNDKAELVEELLAVFIRESGHAASIELPAGYADKRKLLRGLLTVRGPEPMAARYQELLDRLLQTELIERGQVQVEQLEAVSARFPGTRLESADKLSLWQGDITRLNADAIVNAANKFMLGCFQPGHACIDNAIHSAAGPRLREDCNTIMSLQGGDESTGEAKITRGYNLPAAYVIHTVGPIVPAGNPLQELHRLQLASCYRSCLELANTVADIRTIAFCAISTGVFGFPKAEAARIAVTTVDEWLVKNPHHHFDKLIFNVFSAEDYLEYALVF
ncbi:hypothetical protein KC345_g10710, partial [Hortaea werneckii]